MAWSRLGRASAVVGMAALLCVFTRSAGAKKESCMASWLRLSGINANSVTAYEQSLTIVGTDEGNYRTPLNAKFIRALLHRHPSDATKLVHCLGKRYQKCHSRPPCGKGGVCLLRKKKNYYCKCGPGFFGSHCHLDVNECARGLHKCNRNTTCVNTRGSYSCRCKLGFVGNGRQCKEVDECKSQPCANKGKCHDHINRFTCTCRAGFKGKYCREAVDKCRNNPCRNNGTCVNGEKTFTCRCPVQFEGKTCERRWLSSQRFENMKKEHNNILAKVTKSKAEVAADIKRQIAKSQAQTQAAISTVLQKTAILQKQLSSLSQKVDTINKRLLLGSYASPGHSCLDILKSGDSQGDNFYWIKPNHYQGSSYKAYCDMTTEGGGWTLFATKVSYNFVFPATKFNPSSAMSINSNAKGCILPGTKWSEVLFRFGPKPSPVRTIYSRKGGRRNRGPNKGFRQFLECRRLRHHTPLSGFVTYSPYHKKGRRTPKTGYYTHPDFWYYTDYGISGNRKYRFKFVHLWRNSQRGNYDLCDHRNACGSKCIAGVCYLNQPVWLMYR